MPAPAAKSKGLPCMRADRVRKGWRAASVLELTSSSHSLWHFFLAMSRAVSPASFTVEGNKPRDNSQSQGSLEVSMGLGIGLSGYEN